MRALAFLLLLFGPLLAGPAAAGLWTWSLLEGEPRAPYYGLGAAAAAALVEFGLLHRRGVLREATVLALSIFWAGWLWLELTARGYDPTRPPALHAPDGFGRVALVLIVLVYLTLYALAERTRRRRLT